MADKDNAKKETKWVITKEEWEVEGGVNKLKKFTKEPKKGFEKKDILDLIFKMVGLLAIGLPIYIFTLQQQAAIRSQRSTEQAEIITRTASQLRAIQAAALDDSAYNKAKDILSNDLSTKIDLFFPDSISRHLLKTNEAIAQCALIVAFCKTGIDLLEKAYEVGGPLKALAVKANPITAADSLQPMAAGQSPFDSTFSEWRDWDQRITDILIDSSNSDANFITGLQQMHQVHLDMADSIDNIRNACKEIFEYAKDNLPKNQQAIKEQCGLLKMHMNGLKSALIANDRNVLSQALKVYPEKLKAICNAFLADMRKSNNLLKM